MQSQYRFAKQLYGDCTLGSLNNIYGNASAQDAEAGENVTKKGFVDCGPKYSSEPFLVSDDKPLPRAVELLNQS